MEILVLGAAGQLGSCIKKVAAETHLDSISFPDENAGNILDFEGLKRLFIAEQPRFVINCAAYTAVDKAEDDVELCGLINKKGAANIAMLCQEFGAVMVHVSTDFVFAGDSVGLLKETDVANPVNVYGLTKLEGERAIAAVLPAHFIIRTSWLYSEYGNNFVKTMLKLGSERDELSIIADQIGTPTYAVDLARVILLIVGSGKTTYGVYHYSNEGVTSWYDFAQGIFDLSGTDVKLSPIPTSKYPTRAVRPKFSVMDKAKIKETFGLEIPYWRNSLIVCVNQLAFLAAI
ncbi:dTDP-4-dehydrorhamnose reductase [Pedobacter cryoconitis]|uniref:dTDP-4-dehydrorhamnose reductase n=1 Tax=Pedobacter cryoconitis TaxID=188932 RepID=UPI0017907916|nr:dTDP-4-dehydrorhamnose reductase [Pedobacter cryoconitis]MBB6271606.1 dTDP-4-dehydrorhamnose reductase [Pedobacter cryoconitis]